MDGATVLTTDETVTTVPQETALARNVPSFRFNVAGALMGLACILLGQEIFEDSLAKLFPADVKEYDPRESPCHAGCPD